MIKRISVDKLAIGMYISDLDCHWLNHPFLSNRVEVTDKSIIEKIKSVGLKNVYIDTEKGVDEVDAIAKEEIDKQIDAQRDRIASLEKSIPSRNAFSDEISFASRVYKDAHMVVHNMLVDIRIGRQIEIERLEPVIERMTESIFRNKDALITVSRMKQKDEYTFMHSISVAVLMMAFARVMGFEKDQIRQIGFGGMLHDAGKMLVPQSILNKPGALTEEEFSEMKRHVEYGLAVVKDINGLSDLAIDIVAQHHERVDGTGYPRGLKGDAMSDAGKMSTIVDVYDALTSVRVYKNAWMPSEVLRKFMEWSKHHFNEDLVHHFIRCVGIYPVGTLVRLSDDKLAVVIEQSDKHLLQPKVRIIFDLRENKRVSSLDVDLSISDQAQGRKILFHVSHEQYRLNPIDYLH